MPGQSSSSLGGIASINSAQGWSSNMPPSGSSLQQAQQHIYQSPESLMYMWNGTGGSSSITKDLLMTKNMEAKTYRTLKDTPAWQTGAIVTKGADGRYRSTTPLWDNDIIESIGYFECETVVEKSPDWFERVYLVTDATGKKVYKNKADAKALAEAQA